MSAHLNLSRKSLDIEIVEISPSAFTIGFLDKPQEGDTRPFPHLGLTVSLDTLTALHDALGAFLHGKD